MSNKTKAVLAILLAVLLGGPNSVVIKLGLREIPPLTYTFVRFAIAAIILWPILARSGSNVWRALLRLAPLSLLSTANIVLFVFGVQRTTATISQLLYAGVPLMAALIMFLVFKERLRSQQVVGIVVGFVGVCLVVLLPVLEKGTPFSGDMVGNLLIGIAVVVFAFWMVYSKPAQRTYSPLFVTAAFINVTALVLLPFLFLDLANHPGWWRAVTATGMFSLAYIAVISTVIVYFLQQSAIKFGGPVVASLAFYLWPIASYLTAAIVLGERLTYGLVLGGALALAGIYLVTKPKPQSAT